MPEIISLALVHMGYYAFCKDGHEMLKLVTVSRDRDETETATLTFRDRDWRHQPRREVCNSRDVFKTSKQAKRKRCSDCSI